MACLVHNDDVCQKLVGKFWKRVFFGQMVGKWKGGSGPGEGVHGQEEGGLLGRPVKPDDTRYLGRRRLASLCVKWPLGIHCGNVDITDMDHRLQNRHLAHMRRAADPGISVVW